jgi:hypothetical protein
VFIKIQNINYFVVIDNKSPLEVYNEIFSRMNKTRISMKEKKEMIFEITKQIHNK